MKVNQGRSYENLVVAFAAGFYFPWQQGGLTQPCQVGVTVATRTIPSTVANYSCGSNSIFKFRVFASPRSVVYNLTIIYFSFL